MDAPNSSRGSRSPVEVNSDEEDSSSNSNYNLSSDDLQNEIVLS